MVKSSFSRPLLVRNICIALGRQDPTHLYYVHLSNISDDTHNTIIRADGDRRFRLLPANPYPRPAITDGEWHRVDVLRNFDTGIIEVYVDQADEPLFRALDKTYEWGTIGIGSFDHAMSIGRFFVRGEARPAR